MSTAIDTPESPAVEEPADALGRLQALARSGRLAEHYASVPSLLAEIAASRDGHGDLARAGVLLARVDPDDAARACPALRRVKIAVAAHSTVAALVPPLTAELARHHLLLEVTVGDYDGYLRELRIQDSPLHEPGLDLALVVLDAQTVFDDLPEVWRVDDVERAARAKLAQLGGLAGGYVEQADATLVLNTVPLQHTHTRQLVDLASRAALGVAWREFNAGLLKLAARHERLVVLDLDPLVAAGGPVGDPRLAAYAKAHLGEELLARYAREVAHLARALRGMSRKVLVLDLDNTLWDGTLGDDGPDGIAAATTCRGEAFGNFQRVAKQIGSQGVLLAVSSRNDPEPVLQVLRSHPDMRLREQDFVRINANRNPKDADLLDIAAGLGLGVDSFVLAGDSPSDTALVSASLPSVAVVRLDDEPAAHIDRLLSDGWFDVFELTAQDRGRAALYRCDAARQDLLAEAGSDAQCLEQLGARLTVGPVGEPEVARVAQLTSRAGRFNLTALRLTPAEVRVRARDPDHYMLCLSFSDRIGDSGVVGALVARACDEGLRIDNMLLGCRVFARGIAQAAVASLLAHARKAGLGPVWAGYRATGENHGVRDFWPSLGFTLVGGEASAGELEFRHELAELPEIPGHLRMDVDFGR
jgi:FkbH-like protein